MLVHFYREMEPRRSIDNGLDQRGSAQMQRQEKHNRRHKSRRRRCKSRQRHRRQKSRQRHKTQKKHKRQKINYLSNC